MNRKLLCITLRLAGLFCYNSSANKMVNIELEQYKILNKSSEFKNYKFQENTFSLPKTAGLLYNTIYNRRFIFFGFMKHLNQYISKETKYTHLKTVAIASIEHRVKFTARSRSFCGHSSALVETSDGISVGRPAASN